MNDLKGYTSRKFAIRPSWSEARMIMRKPLTDRKIEQYAKRGYYSAEYRKARRELQEQRAKKRSGNFDLVDGRMVYRPL